MAIDKSETQKDNSSNHTLTNGVIYIYNETNKQTLHKKSNYSLSSIKEGTVKY